MKVRIVLRDRDVVRGNNPAELVTEVKERHVEISGEILSWSTEKVDEYCAFLVIRDEETDKELARFVGGSWEYVRVVEDDEDGPDYTS